MPLLDAGARLARLLPPEAAHRAGVLALKAGAASILGPAPTFPALATEIAGRKIPNPVGLAAGFDKDGEAIDGALALGFGFVEVGAVTPRPQAGNARPRVFRLAEDHAVINRYGFNNAGLEAMAARLQARRGRGGVVGVNLGANKDSEDRAGDYVAGLTRLAGLADFFTVNISSPNTPGLRDLQRSKALAELLGRVMEARAGLAGDASTTPLFLKVAPDLNRDEVAAIAEAAVSTQVSGLIVSNTTLERPDGLKSPWAGEAGGLSGPPLFAPSTEILRQFRRATGGRLPLIGVGGVEDGATAYAKIRAGASAVQLYTAMVFRGPGIARRVATELAELMERDGFARMADAVGVDVPF